MLCSSSGWKAGRRENRAFQMVLDVFLQLGAVTFVHFAVVIMHSGISSSGDRSAGQGGQYQCASF